MKNMKLLIPFKLDKPMVDKIRLDKLLQKRGMFTSREKAIEAIESRSLIVHGLPVYKASSMVDVDVYIELNQKDNYVSRGGTKLQHALEDFSINPTGWKALDIGASTGGFSDCLLRFGVSEVVALDVGVGQLDYKLRNDSRVRVLEGINFRYITREILKEKFKIITVDVSFISLDKIIPVALEYLDTEGVLLALFKPQFEVGLKEIRRGIVKNKLAVLKALINLKDYLEKGSHYLAMITPSIIKGTKGNQEYFILLKRKGDIYSSLNETYLEEVILK